MQRGLLLDGNNSMIDRDHRDYLSMYQHYAVMGIRSPEMKLNPDLSLEQYATDNMQKRFPGNYVVEEYFNSKTGYFDLRLKFANESDETWWMLKYG